MEKVGWRETESGVGAGREGRYVPKGETGSIINKLSGLLKVKFDSPSSSFYISVNLLTAKVSIFALFILS
jgi:hypothetical protein